MLCVAARALTRGHAERLLPLLKEVLAQAGWAWRDIDLVAVTDGPGNFTGLRAGIAVARALALALGRPVLGVGTLEMLARRAQRRRPTIGCRSSLSSMPGASELYAQRFSPELRPLTAPALVRLSSGLAAGLAAVPAGRRAAADVALQVAPQVDRRD